MLVRPAELGTIIMPITRCPPGGTLVRTPSGGTYCSYPETEPLRARNEILVKRLRELEAQLQAACTSAGGRSWGAMREACPNSLSIILIAGGACPEVRDPRCLDSNNAARWGAAIKPSVTVQLLENEYFQVKDELDGNRAKIKEFEDAKRREAASQVAQAAGETAKTIAAQLAAQQTGRWAPVRPAAKLAPASKTPWLALGVGTLVVGLGVAWIASEGNYRVN